MSAPSRKDLLRAYKERKQTGGVYVIRNKATNRTLLLSAPNLSGGRHRFEFAQKTKSCVHHALEADWEKYGAGGFSFEVLETLEQGESQTNAAFLEDLKTLEDIWNEKLGQSLRY